MAKKPKDNGSERGASRYRDHIQGAQAPAFAKPEPRTQERPGSQADSEVL